MSSEFDAKSLICEFGNSESGEVGEAGKLVGDVVLGNDCDATRTKSSFATDFCKKMFNKKLSNLTFLNFV